MLLVVTKVLLDVLHDDPLWAHWSIGLMRAQARIHALVINPVIYAEISLSFSTVEALDKVIDTLALEVRDSARGRSSWRQGLRPVSTARRPAAAGAAGLLHRRACGGRGLAFADAGRESVSHLHFQLGCAGTLIGVVKFDAICGSPTAAIVGTGTRR